VAAEGAVAAVRAATVTEAAAHRGAAAVIVESMQFFSASGSGGPMIANRMMSALERITDSSQTSRHVRKVPEGDIADAPQLSPTTSSIELPSCEVAS
jgi:hypothetical protein